MASRKGSYRLANYNLVQLAHRDAAMSEYELLSVVEQIVLRQKLTKAGSGSIDVQSQLWPTADTDRLRNAPDALLLLDATTSVVKQAIGSQTLQAQGSRLELLQHPLCYFEFRRDRKEYASFCHVVGERQTNDLSSVAAAMATQFSDARQSRMPDNEVNSRLRQLTSSNVSLFAQPDAASASTRSSRSELTLLCSILSDHIYRHYHSVEGRKFAELSSAAAALNSPARSGLMNWRTQLESFSCTRDQQGTSDGAVTVQPDAPNCYPYVAVELLDPWPGHMLVCCVGALDQWFVDDRVDADRRLPPITIGVYDISQASHHSPLDRRSLQEALRARLAAISGRVMAFNRGRALESAAGEASNIGRFWFGQGAAKLLETNTDTGGLDTEDVLDFWSRFVRELLCAKIPGIKSTEVFPFDRAIILRGSPANPGRAAGPLEGRVLEAALQSKAAESRFEYLTSLERQGAIDMADLDVTNKIIKTVTELDVSRKADASKLQVSMSTEGKDPRDEDLSIEEVGTAEKDADAALVVEKALRSIFFHHAYAGNNDHDVIRQDAERAVRIAFDEEGFLFEYGNGLDLRAEAPLLYKFDQTYKSGIAGKITPRAQAPKGATADAGSADKDAKVVVVSYDPTLIQSNRRIDRQSQDASDQQSTDYFVSPDEAFTLILLADNDPEKGVQDIAAERDDLRLLVTMILRQKMRDRKREAQLIDRRVNVVEALVDSLMHRVGNDVRDEATRATIQQNWTDVRKAMRFDRRSLEDVEPSPTGVGYLDAILNLNKKTGCDAGQMEKSLHDMVMRYADRSAAGTEPSDLVVRLIEVPIPSISLRLPLAAVRECLDVMIKNAAEAAIDPRASRPAQIFVSVGAHAVDRFDKWALEIIVENTTAPIDREIWSKLTSEEPQAQGKNKSKAQSTGVGVFAARHILQSGLGTTADIRYHLSGPGRVQARMTLPARLVRDMSEIASTQAEAQADADRDAETREMPLDVVYVEDEEKFREPGLAFLREELPGRNTISTDNARDAELAFAISLPRLLITDLSILATAKSDTADAKLGPKLVATMMKRAHDANGFRPPIWIVSAADRSAVRKNFKDLNVKPELFGYRWSDGEVTRAQLQMPATITILEHVKDIAQNENIRLGLGDLFSADALTVPPDWVGVQMTSLSDRAELPASRVKSLKAVLGQSLRSELLALRRFSKETEATLIVHAEPVADLQQQLKLWVSDPGGVDPDSDDNTEYPPWSALAHRRIVLRLPPDRFPSLTIKARYWLLKHNAVATTLGDDELARLWLRVINEPSGPISRLRHDARNLRFDGVPSSKFDDIEAVTRQLDDILALTPEAEELLEQFTDAPRTEDSHMAVTMLGLQDKKELAGELQRLLRRLDAMLAELPGLVAANTSKAAERVAPLRESLGAVQTFLLGS